MPMPGAALNTLLERDDALATLHGLAATSLSTRGQLALVYGEAGVGKSSLLEAFAAQLPAGRLVAWGRCDALFTPRQLGPFYDLAPVLGGQVRAALSRGTARNGLFPDVLAAIGQLPAGATLVLEDVHWADHATLDLLKFIARRMAPLRVLLVLSYRDDEAGPGQPLTQLLGDLPAAATSRIPLQALSREAVQQIAQRHGRDGTVLYQATAGNPFFVSEIVAQPPHASDPLPGSVRDAVMTRLARLPAPERAFLQAISVAPEPLSPQVIGALRGVDGPAMAQACEARGLVRRDADGKIRFRHELARLATLDALPPDQQRQHQQRLLAVYLAMGEAVSPDLLVHHAAALGDVATLLQHAPRAASRAAALGAHKEAAAQLAMALRHADSAAPELAARLHQDWAYEAGLVEVSDAVLASRREAVARWQALGRMDRVGDNLRWLWRLHWYRGEIDQAEAAATQAMAILEAIPPSAELALAYTLRAHIHLLNGRRAESIAWGQRAIPMAQGFGDVDCQVQALVTVATALLFGGDDGGTALMDEALALALREGLHEQAARVYTNYSEYAIVVRRWPLADRLVRDGLAFDIKHNLESWTGYLSGRHAQLHLEQGRLREAQTIARGTLAVANLTLLMRLPAMTALAVTRSRLGADDGRALLSQALEAALAMREQQRLTPVRLGLIEHAYLMGDDALAREHLGAMLAFGTPLLRPWDAGALRVWARRLALPLDEAVGQAPTAAQAAELAGQPLLAADALDAQHAPFEAALCRLVAARAGMTGTPCPVAPTGAAPRPAVAQALDAALAGFEAIGAQAGVQAVRRLAQQLGQPLRGPRRRRGPYKAARSHPLGLTPKEVQVLALLVEGASNAEIAERVSRSPRTIEHHVSAVLAKLNASNRLEAILRAMAEPWIAGS